ncbi:MAG: PAS domain-containing sensor histidine kinase [Syntrophales bacterium]
MRNGKTKPSGKVELRRRAEEQLKGQEGNRQADPGDHRAEREAQRLVHELQVHQIELEAQNDELKEIQERSEESRSRYEDLYDFSPIGYFAFDRKGLIRSVNLTGTKLLGTERASLIGSPFSIFIDAHSMNVFFSHLERVFTDGAKQNCELWLKTRGGSHLPVVLESIRMEERPGSDGQCRSAVIDITKRKKMEEALRESEELFRLTFDKAPIGAAMVGIDQRITRANDELCRMLGYSEEEIVGMTLRDVTHPDDIEAELENFRMMLEGRSESFRMEKRYIRKDGDVVWGRLSAGVIRDAAGRPKYAVRMIEDITQREQVGRHQHLAAEILRILNDPSPLDDSINLILAEIKRATGLDAVGIRLRSGDDCPYFSQDGFSQDFLLAENTLIARDRAGTICRDEKGNILLECTCGLVLSGQADPANPLFTKGGSFWTNSSPALLDLPAEEDPRLRPRNTCIREGYLSVALIPIYADQAIVGLLQLNDRRKGRFTLEMIRLFEGIAASIGTALVRKLTERVLEKRTVQLEEVNRELESFSYSVSHDLRAPLRAIDGFSRMILRNIGEHFDEETGRQFNLIRDNVRKMGQLIDDILAFSRLGKQGMAVSTIDMDELVREAWDALRTVNPDRRVTLRSDGLPPGTGDRALIRQVFTNLLSNAIKFTGNRDAALVEVGGCADENETVYYVKDNGVGFDMAYHHKLFGVFQRLHSEDQFEGTGVGLAIVQRIIHRHGGRVWAEGKVDGGATFSFSLPGNGEC